MKREELKALGVADDVIEKIMGLHGTALAEQKSKLDAATQKATDLQGQVTQLTGDLIKAQATTGNVDDIKKQLADAQAALAATTKAQKVRDALTAYKPRDAGTLMRLLDLDKVTITDAGPSGLKEQVDALRAAQDYLFADAADPKGGADPKAPGGAVKSMNDILRGL